MAIRIQLRRDTAANWVSSNPTLRAGEVGIETDTLKFKVGNGSSPWNSITSYANVVPGDLNNTLNGYLETGDLSVTVAELVDGNLFVPGTDIELTDTYTVTLTSSNATDDRTVTFPDATTTLVGTDTTDTLTNKTLTSPVVSGLTLSDASIVFEGAVADSYETTLTVGEPTADRTITLPDITGTVVTTGDTGSVTNTMLAGSISNDKLANSSITINGTATSLGGTRTLGTDDISEGSTNKYFTDERAQDAVAAAIAAGSHTNVTITYDDNANTLSFTGAVTYTDENAQDAVGNAVGNGLDYDDNTGAISVDPSEFALSAVGAPIADVSMASYKITNLATPTSSGDAATKAYVDNTTAGLNFHAAVHAATTGNLDATYNNGTSGVGATLTANANGALVIDGHTLNASERVLVKDQTTGSENGIYVVTSTGDVSNPYVLTRATDADNSPAGEVAYGDFTFVQNGSTNAGFGYIVNTTGTITIGTTAISYTQFNAGQVVVAGNGLTEATPGTLSIDTGVTVDLNTAQTLTNKIITGTFTGNLTGNADTVTNGVYTNAANTIIAASASTNPLIIRGAASQTANLQEWQNSSGTLRIAIRNNGSLFSNTSSEFTNAAQGGGNSLLARTSYASEVPVAVRGASSQTANLQEWQDSSGATLASVNFAGTIAGPNINASASLSGTQVVRVGSASADRANGLGVVALANANTAPTTNPTGGGVLYATSGALLYRGTSNPAQQIVGADGSISFTAPTSSTIGVVIKGASSQSANLQEWQNSSGTVLARVNSGGAIVSSGIGVFGAQSNTPNAQLYVLSNNISNPTLVVKSAASQTANLTEWQNSDGTVLNRINSSGHLIASSRSVFGGATSIVSGMIVAAVSQETAAVPILARGSASQTADLTQWQNSSGTVLASVNASGQFVGDGSQLTGLTTALTTPSAATLTANTATTVDTTALSAFTSLEYMVSLKQASKVRTSKVVLQTDGTSVDMTEFAITETGGSMSGVVISATTSGTDAVLQATVTDASTTNVTVKLAKISL